MSLCVMVHTRSIKPNNSWDVVILGAENTKYKILSVGRYRLQTMSMLLMGLASDKRFSSRFVDFFCEGGEEVQQNPLKNEIIYVMKIFA